jgi:prevent-host-death family protein
MWLANVSYLAGVLVMKTPTVRYISATEAKNRFGEVIREAYRGEHHLIVQRDGIPVVAILPVYEYEQLVQARNLPVVDTNNMSTSTVAFAESGSGKTLASNPASGGHEEYPLAPLTGLSDQELAALARAVVAPERQAELATALEKNRNPGLSANERLSLDDLLDSLLAEVDQVALLKARALYTLQLRAK